MKRLRPWLAPVVSLALIGLAGFVIHKITEDISVAEIRAAVAAIPIAKDGARNCAYRNELRGARHPRRARRPLGRARCRLRPPGRHRRGARLCDIQRARLRGRDRRRAPLPHLFSRRARRGGCAPGHDDLLPRLLVRHRDAAWFGARRRSGRPRRGGAARGAGGDRARPAASRRRRRDLDLDRPGAAQPQFPRLVDTGSVALDRGRPGCGRIVRHRGIGRRALRAAASRGTARPPLFPRDLCRRPGARDAQPCTGRARRLRSDGHSGDRPRLTAPT